MKFRQLDDESDHDEETQEQKDAEMAIAMIQSHGSKQYWDDLSGKPLIPELVEKARLEELGNRQSWRLREGAAGRMLESHGPAPYRHEMG